MVKCGFEKGDDPVGGGKIFLRNSKHIATKSKIPKTVKALIVFWLALMCLFSHEKAISEGLTGQQRK
jgi:hypothetical protein